MALPFERLSTKLTAIKEIVFGQAQGCTSMFSCLLFQNGTHTKYYSNTTRFQHIKDNEEQNATQKEKLLTALNLQVIGQMKNRTIPDLVDFTKTFFAKHTILNILTRYCVFTSENLLLVMRPYQIAATEKY